jgi:hypothetical protein
MRTLTAVVMSVILSAAVVAADAPPAPRTGSYTETFTERGPNSPWEVFGPRYGVRPTPEDCASFRKSLAKESFDIYVPPDYDGSAAYGIVSYTSPSAGGGCFYQGLMDKHHLIWIGASNVPNERNAYERWMLSLDGVWYMTQRYRIDPKRIYTSGMSGGGRCASEMAAVWPDVFTGGIYICGCNLELQGEDAQGGARVALAKTHRYAFITGSNDFNHDQTKQVMDAYVQSGFTLCQLFDVPNMGHECPVAEWYEKAIVFCDAPLVDQANAEVKDDLAKAGKHPAEAWLRLGKLVADFPVAEDAVTTAKAKIAELAAPAEAEVKPQVEQLVKAGKAEPLRAFAVTYAGLPSAQTAHDQADGFAATELAALVKSGGTSLRGKLEKMLPLWEGYTVEQAMADAYDHVASTALAPALAQPAGSKRIKALTKALPGWRACPAVAAATQTLDDDLEAELATIKDLPAAKRGPALTAFIASAGTRPAAAEAQGILDAEKAPTAAPVKQEAK